MAHLVEVITDRANRWVRSPTIMEPGELPEWWHVSWERLGDVAFAQAVAPDPNKANWLRTETLRLCSLPVDEWVGPFFRMRSNPPVGALETAHVGLGVAEVLELCAEVLTGPERDVVVAALISHCMLPCERALLGFEENARRFDASNGAEGIALNNWYMVLLNGFAAVTLLLGDQDRIDTLPERYTNAAALYNTDSYGESLQYWGYATLHLSNVRELIGAHDAHLLDRMPAPYGGMVPWVAHSVMFQGPRQDLGEGLYTTMVNFGDAAVTARPPADVLTSIARSDAGTTTEDAGLARWLFERAYDDVQLEPSSLSTFGFFSQIGWRTIVNLLVSTEPISPTELSIPESMSFETGSVIVRDRWDDPLTVLAAQAGTTALQVDSHRHDDHGSFVLSHRHEIFFTDPGHCSYRLQAQHVAKQAGSHSTWLFRDGHNGQLLERHYVHAEPVGTRRSPRNRDGWTTFSVDLADSYPDQVTKARRTWITLLPHIVVIVDDIVSKEPIEVETLFVLNDRDHRLRVNQAADTRLVLRRGESAAKFFRLHAATDGQPVEVAAEHRWTALHDIYQPQPNAPTQGREGNGVVYSYTDPTGTQHRAVYSIVLDNDAHIRGWHVYVDDADLVCIERPDGSRISLDPFVLADD